ncbi:hypothetical protein PYCCODRAFT_1059857 [Trametes coccinea BRFM310]|uniref:Uncharacterized protein n=1 Tax=Trametes coccinea (strain BRFM310) TaxID=1353009 RepID=A0A1Y2J0G7_TRAC3|nr:hypothetical protein PYCCODRAFT_1059857 [Trametes coccinea BRFM310]
MHSKYNASTLSCGNSIAVIVLVLTIRQALYPRSMRHSTSSAYHHAHLVRTLLASIRLSHRIQGASLTPNVSYPGLSFLPSVTYRRLLRPLSLKAPIPQSPLPIQMPVASCSFLSIHSQPRPHA